MRATDRLAEALRGIADEHSIELTDEARRDLEEAASLLAAHDAERAHPCGYTAGTCTRRGCAGGTGCQALALAAEQAQKPVATVRVHKTGGNAGIAWTAVPTEDAPLLPDGANLYAAPVEQAAQAVPAGFKLVPVEPDLGMLQSALNASRANVACGMTRMLTDGCELWAAGEVYRAMLAAAPAAPAPEAKPEMSKAQRVERLMCRATQLERHGTVYDRLPPQAKAAPAPEAQAVPAVLKLSDGAKLVREGPHWSLRRDGNHIRYLNRFETEFIRAAMQAAPQAQAAGQDEREAFEAWFAEQHDDLPDQAWEKEPGGRYVFTATQRAWEEWRVGRAALAQCPQAAPAPEGAK